MGWAKDEMLTKEIAKVMKSTAGADMIYTISGQGHGSYPEEKVLEAPEITVSGLPTEEETNAMEYYVAQIHEMDQFVGELVDYLEDCGEETVLVLYGDHLPSLDLTEEKLENGDVFQTEYVIWDNIGLERSKRDVEAYQLGAWVLDRVGIQKGTMFRYHQAWLQELVHTEEEKEKYLEDMKLLEYDILYGDQEVFEGKNPYQATDLHMGVQPITVSQVMTQSRGVYVAGWNYTPSSVVYLNGEACETDYVSMNLLYCGDASLEEGTNEVTVCQVSEDNIVLSATQPYVLVYHGEKKP